MSQKIYKTLVIPTHLATKRLDQALTQCLPEYSRTLIQTWIKNGEILVNGQPPRPHYKIKGEEEVTIDANLPTYPEHQPQSIPLDIIFEDNALLIINKPAGLVVHPGAGNAAGTLLNALLHHCVALKNLPRAGILHRLDKDTSGLLIIAKTVSAYSNLTKQLKARTISRIYQAVIGGVLASGGTIDKPIGRHPIHRIRMAITEDGKKAVTHYRVVERYLAHTRIKVMLETGRTHQIRVHMASIRHPILGDQTYGGRLKLPKGASESLITVLRNFKRQALHASELTLHHPETKKIVTFQAPLPEDFHKLIEILRQDSKMA